MMPATAPTPDVSAEHLARGLGISLRTARRYKAAGEMPAVYALAWAIAVDGDLGAVFPTWRGWSMRDGQLWAPEGYGFHPGEVRAIPLRAQQIAHMTRELSEPRQLCLPA